MQNGVKRLKSNNKDDLFKMQERWCGKNVYQ